MSKLVPRACCIIVAKHETF